MAKRVSARSIKLHRLYTYDEAADALGITVQTIRSWRDHGLSVLTQRRPHYIRGVTLKEFIKRRSKNSKRPLSDDEFFCMSCKAPRRAFGMMVDYVPISETRGRLEALCEACEGQCNRFISATDIPRLSQKLEIAHRYRKDA